MKKQIRLLMLIGLALWSSCSNDDPTAQDFSSQQWTITGSGGQGELEGTRAVSFSGKSRFYNWRAGDNIDVYNQYGMYVGSLTVTPDAFNAVVATLTGHSTWTGTFSVGEQLMYYYPTRAADYRGQDGSVKRTSDYYTYMKASPRVTEVDGENRVLHVGFASFSYAGAMAWLKFKRTDETTYLHPTRIIMHAEVGSLVLTDDGAGKRTTGDLDINIAPLSQEGNYVEYPLEILVAFRNTNTTDQATYSFRVYEGDAEYRTEHVSLSANVNNNVYTDTRYYAPGGIEATIDVVPVSVKAEIYNWDDNAPSNVDITY